MLTQKLLKKGYWYHKLRKTFSNFFRRYYDLISKFQVRLKSLLRQGLLEPDFYDDLVYKLKKIVGSNNFSAQFIKIISETEEHKVGKIIDKLQVKKATGVDKISCKILKLAKTALQSPLTGLINLSVRTSPFLIALSGHK